jgi:hypothetical protein
MFSVHLDKEGDVVFVVFWVFHLTFYKPYQNRLPIVTFRRDTE